MPQSRRLCRAAGDIPKKKKREGGRKENTQNGHTSGNEKAERARTKHDEKAKQRSVTPLIYFYFQQSYSFFLSREGGREGGGDL